MSRKSFSTVERLPAPAAFACRVRVSIFLLVFGTTLTFAQNTETVESRLATAHQQLQQTHLPQAEQTLRDTLALAPTNAEAHYLLGYVLFREVRAKESLAEYTAAAQLRQPTAEELTVIASDYVLLKDFADADKWLQYATTLAPTDPQIWYLLGRTQYNEDHAAEAARSFERCLALRPQEIRAEYNLGLAYEKLQQPADAIAAYQTAIRWQSGRAPQDPQPYLDLGTLLLRQGKYAEALDPLQLAVRYSPANAFAQQQLGLTLEGLGRFDEAIDALKRAAALAPTAEQPHFFLGRVYRRLGRDREATAEYATVSHLLGTHSDTVTPNLDQQP